MGSRSSKSESVGSRPNSDHAHHKNPSLQNKNDPNQALTEDQPMVNTATTSYSLQAMQHHDHYGRPITEPDLANPTRYRFERPLDTIKGFETAVARNHRQDVIP
ncbi:Uncharacterized protein DUF2406 [Aspergillus sp. HF37]|nr:Uncharacterized protein DUF2406 [Aspergillus sp. HF37]